MSDRFLSSYIPNPYLTSAELKGLLAREIGAHIEDDMPADQLLLAINERLLELAGNGVQVVLVIDEAQAMPRDTIETLRLLTNLETEKRKLLQVVLFGQPELDTMLNRADLRQLKQRIVFSEYLRPFSGDGARRYLDHRLYSAGADRPMMSRTAVWMLSKASRGVPRVLNILAHKAMLAAFGRGAHAVGTQDAARAIADTEEVSWQGKLLALRWNLLWPVVGVALALLYLHYQRGGFGL